MKGYVYITGMGIDPGLGDFLGDPNFGKTSTLGACMPNIRKRARVGDYIFVISGKNSQANQYVIGGLQVAEKIHANDAYNRFPEMRLVRGDDGAVFGNVIVDGNGNQHPLDHHRSDTFDERVMDYIVGGDSIQICDESSVARGRDETLSFLCKLFGKQANRPFDVIGRGGREMDQEQLNAFLHWIHELKAVND